MHGEFWFRPKAFGYGASPIAWQGWALVAGYMVAAAATAILLVRSEMGFAAWTTWVLAMVIATAASILVSWLKTDGSWQWRWSNIENLEKQT
jgi:hypothetical protein